MVRLALAVLLTLTSLTIIAGCGADETGTALAVEGHRWAGPGRLEVVTACADDLEAEVGADHSGSDLPQVTVWGTPRLGRCSPSIDVAIPPETTQIVDGATGTVIDLTPPGPSPQPT